jgi:hypothetical protein
MEGRKKALEESQESFRRLSERLQVGVHRSDVKVRTLSANGVL